MIVRVRITGRVQGVWFRSWTEETASSFGLEGWVRNCSDGSVEAQFEGEDGLVQEMIKRCHEGPPLARVESVDVVPEGTTCGERGFRII